MQIHNFRNNTFKKRKSIGIQEYTVNEEGRKRKALPD